MNKPYLSVVIPSYNEMKNIQRGVLDEVLDYLKKQSYDWELIMSDDGSTDGTAEKLDEFAKRDERIKVIHNVHAGKAPTVKSGMLNARGKWRLFTDFDQSTPLKDVEKLLKYAQEGIDVVVGSREIVGAKRTKESFLRHLMGRVFNILVQILAIPGFLDTQCGFKLFSDKATEDLYNALYVYGKMEERKDAFTGAFDVELLYLGLKKGYVLQEVPINWRAHKSDRVSPVKDSLRMLRDIVIIRISDLQGKYN
jgi:dolichyl-phosphate beta-glucosyltransferase